MNTNKEKMIEMKAWLKDAAKKIREGKKAIKEYQKGHGGCYPFDWGGKDSKAPCLYRLKALQSDYRHKHIAYSLAIGKPIDQIESKHGKDEFGNECNLPSMSLVNTILFGLLTHEEVPQ